MDVNLYTAQESLEKKSYIVEDHDDFISKLSCCLEFVRSACKHCDPNAILFQQVSPVCPCASIGFHHFQVEPHQDGWPILHHPKAARATQL